MNNQSPSELFVFVSQLKSCISEMLHHSQLAPNTVSISISDLINQVHSIRLKCSSSPLLEDLLYETATSVVGGCCHCCKISVETERHLKRRSEFAARCLLESQIYKSENAIPIPKERTLESTQVDLSY